MADLDLNELERLALKATPQQFDTAELKRENGVMDCPICHGEGSVDTEAEYCNYDGRAIGVEFYGIGKEFGAAERYYRAARPAVILAMIARIRELEQRAAVADNRSIYDGRVAVDLAVTRAAPRLYWALKDLLEAVRERVDRCGIESVTISAAENALLAAAPTQQQEGGS
ncbi:hypothetical protein ACI2VH_02660 [Ralstonia nicotianae]